MTEGFSGPSICCDHHGGWADAPSCEDLEADQARAWEIIEASDDTTADLACRIATALADERDKAHDPTAHGAEMAEASESLAGAELAEAWERGYAAGVRHIPGQWTPNPYLCDEAVYVFGALSPCQLVADHDGDHRYAYEPGL